MCAGLRHCVVQIEMSGDCERLHAWDDISNIPFIKSTEVAVVVIGKCGSYLQMVSPFCALSENKLRNDRKQTSHLVKTNLAFSENKPRIE